MEYGGRYTSPAVCRCLTTTAQFSVTFQAERYYRLQLLQVGCCLYVGNLAGLAVAAGCLSGSAQVSPSA